ncbi:MAG: hypothetical protein ABIJ23_01845 [Candidatus Magasanikbacteria bacterium]
MQDKNIDIKLHKILKKSLKSLCLLYAIVTTFAVANFPVMKFAYFFGITRDSAVIMRSFVFFIAIIILFYFAFKNIGSLKSFLSWNTFFRSIWVSIFLLILVSTLKVAYMGEVYANISLSPFDQDIGFFYRRILEPALAYFLQLKGEVLYGIFHFLITFSCIYLIIAWLEKKLFVKLRIWQLVSIMTAGIIINQFQSPGYPEPLILLMALISLFIPLNKYGRISILALMFLTHESAALFLGLVFSWFYFPKEERKYYVLLPLLFYLLWLANYGFSFTNLFLGHLTLTNGNALSLFLKNISNIGLPIFFAYKFLWFFVIFSLYDYLKQKKYKSFIRIATIIIVPLALIVIPDTSRVIAWGSIGVFLAVAHSYKYLRSRMFNLILMANLILPSVAVGIGSGGPVSYAGLYGFFIDLFKLFVKNYLM